MLSTHRLASAAATLVLSLAAALLVFQLWDDRVPTVGAVTLRFLGAEKDQAHVSNSDDSKGKHGKEDGAGQTGEESAKGDAENSGENQEQESDAANSTSSQGMNATELDRHYDRVFDKLEGKESLPPWYLVPPLLVAKQTFTFLVFGFDLRFEEKAETSCCKLWMFFLVRSFFQVVSCLLVVNGYRADYTEYLSAVSMLDEATPEEGITILEHFGLFMQVIVTSGNFTSSVIVFVATLGQRSACGDPAYPSFRCLDSDFLKLSVFPVVPFTAQWIGHLKHLYMYLLLPYMILPLLFNNLFLGCICLWKMVAIVKVTCGCLICSALTVITITLVPSFYDSAAEFGGKLWPFWHLLTIVFSFSLCLVIVLMSWPAIKGKSCNPDLDLDAVMDDDKRRATLKTFAHLQPDVATDFRYSPVSDDEPADPLAGQLAVLSGVTVASFQIIGPQQIITLACIRVLLTGHFFAAFAEVLDGRSLDGYTTHLTTQMHDGATQAAFLWGHREEHFQNLSAALQGVSMTVNALWTL